MHTLLLTPPAPRLMDPATFSEDMLPPKSWVPLGIAYLGAVLRRHGYSAGILDLHDYSWEEVMALLEVEAPDIVGISCFTANRTQAWRLAHLAKELLPDATVVMGGPHATFFPLQVLKHMSADIVVLGQAEETIVELVRCLAENGNLDEIHGIAYKKHGRFIITPAGTQAPDLDALPFPAYDAFNLQAYKSSEIPPQYIGLAGTHLLTSRGCPFHCQFCSVNHFFNGKWAFRSPDSVADELEMLIEEHNVRHVYFSDDLFTLDHNRTVGICKEILRRGLDLVWMAETRVDCVNEEMLFWMRKAGCYRVYYGVESGSPRILRAISKGFTVANVRNAFAMTHKAGIEPCCFLMVGNPGETPDTINETISLIREIRPATLPIMGITTILPGTGHYELAKQQGLISDAYWLTSLAPPLYTGEQSVDDLIALQLQLTRGIAPQVYEQLCHMGFDDNYFRMRRMARRQ